MGVKLTEEFVERVKAETDILTVVSAYVPLKRSGNRYWGCCPFHHEKTPSFQVKPEEGFFYCFGCHVGGNAFKFISLIDNINYYEAVKRQAEKLGIPIPQAKQTQKEIERENYLNDLRKLHEMASNFFFNCLTKTPYGKAGLEYLHQRGINDQIIQDFKIGFAPNAFDKLTKAFLRREIPEKLLLDSGLAKKNQDGITYDKFRNRVMIPIADARGRIIAFGGRVIGQGEPKYLNSPETPIFNKRELFFGMDKARKAIQKEGFALVVEGYMDAISVYAAGIHNVVASLGTAFTKEQCRHVMKYGAELYFCYDSDTAGQNATARGLAIAASLEASVKIVSIPDGKDPDEFIRKYGVEAFRQLIKQALPLLNFYMKFVESKIDISTLEGKQKALNEILPILGSINESKIENNIHVRKVSEWLSTSEDIVKNQMLQKNNTRINNNAASPVFLDVKKEQNSQEKQKVINQYDGKDRRAARICIRAIWEDPSLIPHLESMLPRKYMLEWMQEVLQIIEANILNGNKLQIDEIMNDISEINAIEFSHALLEDFTDNNIFSLYDETTHYLHGRYLNTIYDQLRKDSLIAYDNKDMVKYMELAKSMDKIQKEMDEYKIDNRINFS